MNLASDSLSAGSLSGGNKGAKSTVAVRTISDDHSPIVETSTEGSDRAGCVDDHDTAGGEQERVCETGVVFKLAGNVAVIVNGAGERVDRTGDFKVVKSTIRGPQESVSPGGGEIKADDLA